MYWFKVRESKWLLEMCRFKVCPREEVPSKWAISGRVLRHMGTTLTTRSLLIDSWSWDHESPARELQGVDGVCFLP